MFNNKFPYKIIDLTHELSEKTSSWNGKCGFKHETKLDYDECDSEVKFKVQQVKMHAGIGTHIDTPSHCIQDGKTAEQLDLNKLIAPLIVINIHKKVTANYKILEEDIISFEEKHGKIEKESFVAFYTGWSKYWNNPKKYHNNLLFPTISESVANLLVSREVVGIGIDTLSPDLPSSGFPVHKIILGADKYIVENITNLEKIDEIGSYIVILPIKGVGLTEAPVRIIGLTMK